MNAYKLDHLLNVALFEELSAWLRPKLDEIHGNDFWWGKGVYSKLTENQRRKVQNSQRGTLEELDLLALLHVSINNIRELNYHYKVPRELRVLLDSVRQARNELSHRSGGKNLNPEDLLLHALNTKKVLQLIGASQDNIAIADSIILSINDPDHEKSEIVTINDLTGGKLKQLSDKEISDSNKKQLPENDAGETEKDIAKDADKIDVKENYCDTKKRSEVFEIIEGQNELIPAELKDCQLNSNRVWQMTLSVYVDKKERIFELMVPHYLSESAKAAADIIKSIKGRENPKGISINLINVNYHEGRLFYPEDPSKYVDAYPLIVILPSYMINVTSLIHFEYCPRNYLMERYSIEEPNQSMERGALVHNLFEHLMKNPDDKEHLMEQCHQNMDKQMPSLSMQGVSPDCFYDDVRPHLNALVLGLSDALDFNSIKETYVERYMINPVLGLKGKIDALIHKKNGNWQALELKTGKSWGDKANFGHASQVSAYNLLLAHANIGSLDPPCVIYTGNQAQKYRNNEPPLNPKTMIKQVPFSVIDAIKLINIRNVVVRIDYTGELEFNDNPNKCSGCLKIENANACVKLHYLGLNGGKDIPECLDDLAKNVDGLRKNKMIFSDMNQALLEEFQAIRLEHGQLLQMLTTERISKGVCAIVKKITGANDGLLKIGFPGGNSSEFREGDPCLLSDEDGPTKGNCIEVYIRKISKNDAEVNLPTSVKELWFEPAYLDVNAPDTAFQHNFAALFNLWDIAGKNSAVLEPIRRILLDEVSILRPNDLIQYVSLTNVNPSPNSTQVKAVGLAKGLKDILLIQGPPGTGKTYTLALAVKELFSKGKTVAIATYTHRAADEVISKLSAIAPEIKVRKLGRIEAASSQHTEKCLDKIYRREDTDNYSSQKETLLEDLNKRQGEILITLSEPVIYIGTTYAWLSGKYDALPAMMAASKEVSLFDYMIVDEASQVITPNLAGVLRLAEKWILVGDHMQLPPIIKSDEQSMLKKTLFEKIANYSSLDETILVQLDTQHRMPPGLANFIGEAFYNGNLRTEVHNSTQPLNSKHPMLQDQNCITLIKIKQGEGIRYKSSQEESNWIVKTIKELNDSGWPMYDESGKPTIGVIAPYRAQVALLRRNLERKIKEYEPDYWNQVVDTVDRFQGDEREIIILSLCINLDDMKIPRIYQEIRRINVSLSRAKKKLWIVGFIEGMDLIPGLREFKAYAEANPQFCSIISEDKDASNSVSEIF